MYQLSDYSSGVNVEKLEKAKSIYKSDHHVKEHR